MGSSDHPRGRTDGDQPALHRRSVIAGAVAGVVGGAAVGGAVAAIGTRGSANDAPSEGTRSHDGEELGIEEPVASLRTRTLNNVEYVDVAEGAAAVQAAVDAANGNGHNKVVVHGSEGEWNRTVYLPSEFTLEFGDGVTITSSMTEADTEVFHGGAALITNDDHANGNHDITVRGGHVDFEGVDSDENGIRWGPVWLHTVDRAMFDSVTVENVDWRYGAVFTDCTRSLMVDCRARNIGYDGVTLRGTCEHVDVVRCSVADTGGAGIQAAPSIGEAGTGGHHLNFINCRADEHLAIHGVRSGITNVGVHGCSVRRIGIIENVDGFHISNCDVDTVALSALSNEIRNGRIDSVTMGPRYEHHDEQVPVAVILWGLGDDLIENITVSNCTARGHEKFVECRLLEETSTARHIDFTDCAYDPADAGGGVFIEHTPAGDQASVGELSKVRIHSGTIWNVDHVVEGPIDGLRIRDTELHSVGELHDGAVTDLETRDNDRW